MPRTSKRKREEEVSAQPTEALQTSVYEGAYELGRRYESGVHELKQDMKTAFAHYLFAAEGGHAEAQLLVARFYEKGETNVVVQDSKKAFGWYTKAAEQQHKIAEYELGVCYEKGEGVAKDKPAAMAWYTKSANQGFSEAQLALGLCLYSEPDGHNNPDAKKWIKAASDQKNREARYQYALLFKPSGRPITRSTKDSIKEEKLTTPKATPSTPKTHSVMFVQRGSVSTIGVQAPAPARKENMSKRESVKM